MRGEGLYKIGYTIMFVSKMTSKAKKKQRKIRKIVHVMMSLVLVFVVIIFKYFLDRNVIDGLLTIASYTYGPLLGLFSFGIFTPYKINDNYVWLIVILSVLFVFFIGNLDKEILFGLIGLKTSFFLDKELVS